MLGYKVMTSDREKTAIDCIDHPPLAGGVGEAATILATASRRFDWNKAADYLERIGAGEPSLETRALLEALDTSP